MILTYDQPRWRWPAAAAAALIVTLVAWARIQIDDDLPSGVLAGLAIAALLLLFADFAIDAMEIRHPVPAASPAGSA